MKIDPELLECFIAGGVCGVATTVLILLGALIVRSILAERRRRAHLISTRTLRPTIFQ